MALAEVLHHQLPETGIFPPTEVMIRTQLDRYGLYKQKVIETRGGMYNNPLPGLEPAIAYYDDALSAFRQGNITQAEFSECLNDLSGTRTTLGPEIGHKPTPLAKQINFLASAMTSISRGNGYDDEIDVSILRGLGDFGVDVDHPETVFNSLIFHPYLQAQVLNLIGIHHQYTSGSIDPLDCYRLALATNYFISPRNQSYRLSGMADSLERIGSQLFVDSTANSAVTVDLYSASSDLYVSMHDQRGIRMMERAATMYYIAEDYYGSISAMEKAVALGNRLEIPESQQAALEANLVLTRFGAARAIIIQVDQGDWESLSKELDTAIDKCNSAKLKEALVDLYLAQVFVREQLNDKIAMKSYRKKAKALVQTAAAYAKHDFNVHPAVRDLYTGIAPQKRKAPAPRS